MQKFSPDKANRLENNERYEFLKPEVTLRNLGLKEGMIVADIGAGTGFFSRTASTIVGKNGKVFALDISSEMLDAFKRYGISQNMELIKSTELELPLESNLSDFTLLAFVLHESNDIQQFLNEISRITKPKGKIAIIDWIKQDEEHGPPRNHRISLNELKTHLKNFVIITSGNLNPSHYYCIIQTKQ